MSYGIVQAGFINHGKIIDLTALMMVLTDDGNTHVRKPRIAKLMMTSGNIILISCTSPSGIGNSIGTT